MGADSRKYVEKKGAAGDVFFHSLGRISSERQLHSLFEESSSEYLVYPLDEYDRTSTPIRNIQKMLDVLSSISGHLICIGNSMISSEFFSDAKTPIMSS